MNLTLLRKSKGLSGRTVAGSLGISAGYYSQLESGQRAITPNLITELAKVLDEPEEIIKAKADELRRKNLTVSSWIAQMKINNLPLLKAFRYHLMAYPLDDINSEEEVKERLIGFISRNLMESVIAELNENKDLAKNIIKSLKGSLEED